MLKIRLKRFGRKKRPVYRIVVADSRIQRDGKCIEEVGFYNPLTDETHFKVDRILTRLQTGAQPTATVRNLFVKAKIIESN